MNERIQRVVNGCPCGRECINCTLSNHNGCVRRTDACKVNEGPGVPALKLRDLPPPPTPA